MSMEHVFETGDGRKLAVTEGGDPDGVPCLVHQGTPNSRLQYGPDVAVAREHGIRMITYDRPGYGGSTAQPGRTIADCAADARTICAGLGVERILSWGISGGGPHVLACAALLPDVIPAAASLASPAPFDAEGLDWFAGMGELNADDYRLMVRDKVAARAKLEAERVEMLGANAEQVLQIITTLVSPVDAAVFTPELRSTSWIAPPMGSGQAVKGGGRTVSPTWRRGVSSSRTSRSRCCSCTGGRIASCRSDTACGSLHRFPPSKLGSPRRMAISR
jgi:pimeloyl-ACP methyl ester carboxylesterase